MQLSFDKLSYRNNTADTIKLIRIATEGCSQGWIHSGDTPSKSTDLAVAPVTAAGGYPGIVSGNGALTFCLSKLPLFHEGKNVPAHLTWCFLLII